MRRTRLKRSGRLRAASRKRLQVAVDYASFRLGILARDGFRCQYCRTTRGALDLHHVTKRSQGGKLCDADNVVTLCRACHNWTDAAFASKEGRLVVTPLGRSGFAFDVLHGDSKFQLRAIAGSSAVDNR